MANDDSYTRYSDLCRLCATKTNMVLGINIFENEGSIRQIDKKIETCLPVQVHESDELPKMICENCICKLDLFIDFRERSIRTENILISLFKEISTTKIADDDQQMVKVTQSLNVAGLDHTNMIMIQHHPQLLNAHMQNVDEIDLSQLQQRDMIVDHEIIINPHTLANINLDHHELASQDLSNEGTILVDETNGVRYEEDLHLIQHEHQLLSEQYNLQDDLHVSNAVCSNGIAVATSSSNQIQKSDDISENKYGKTEKMCSKLEMALKQEKCNFNKVENSYTISECATDQACVNSENQLVINTEYNDDIKDDIKYENDLYVQSSISCDDSNTSIDMISNVNDNEWLHCNMCGKSFSEKMEFQIHYEEHFNKCIICLAVFTNRDALNAHRKEMHGSTIEETKMPKYQRKTTKAQWDPETMTKALAFVENGGSIRQAGRSFNIPESSIRKAKKAVDDGVDVVGPRMGKHCVFSSVQEKELKDHILKLAKLYHGLTKDQLRKLAFSYAETNKIKHNFNVQTLMAGKDWYYGFLKRCPEITLGKPEPTSINRISANNKGQVSIFFENLKKLYDKFNFKENAIYNVDEIGISTVQKPCKRLGSKGVKQFGAKTSGERGKTVTVICCFNASGTCYVAPMFIFPRLRMTNTLTKNGPSNAIYSCSKSGWSNEQLFYQWLQHFKKTVKPSKDEAVLLLLDNHSSHISLPIFDYCKDHGIILLTIPPHTSHRLQPLDISFYGPLKSALNKQCDCYLTTTGRITQYDLAEIFNRAYTRVATMNKAQLGFNASGIWPYQPDKFIDEDFLPASHHLPAVIDDDLPSTSSSNRTNASNKSDNSDYVLTGANDLNALPITENRDAPVASKSTSLEELSPLPKASITKPNNRKKQKSEILTGTPNRERLEEAATKRVERQRRLEKRQDKSQKKGSKIKNGSKKEKKRKIFDEGESEDISENELCNDGEMDNQMETKNVLFAAKTV